MATEKNQQETDIVTSSTIEGDELTKSEGNEQDFLGSEEETIAFERFLVEISESARAKLSKSDCLRFLRARKWNVSKAVEMANNWDVWYQTPIRGADGVTPQTILHIVEDKNEEIYRRLMPHSNMYEDKCGRPVYWELTGEISSRFGEVLTQLTCDDLVIRHIRQQEMMVKRLEYASKKHNTLIEKQVIVFNLANMSYSVDTNAISVFRQTLAIDEAYYPERLHCLYMINAPWFFTAIWSMIRPWLDPITANKIKILGSDFIEILREEIADDQIPPLYGGSGKDFTWTWPFPADSGCAPEQLGPSPVVGIPPVTN